MPLLDPPQSVLILSQLVGISTLIACVFAPYDSIHDLSPWNLAGNMAYNLLSRFGWGVGLALLTFPSIVFPNHNRALHSLVSWPAWSLIAKLSYCVYLVHCFVINVLVGGNLRTQPVTNVVMVTMFGSVMFWSYLAGAVLYVAVEAPTAFIIKHFTSPKRP